MAVDADSNVYVADRLDHRVRRIDAAGVITTFAGTGASGYGGDGGPATEAQLSYPTGIAVDAAGIVYVADRSNHRVRRIDVAGIITTFAGTGTSGHSGGRGAGDRGPGMSYPAGVAVDAAGIVYVADRSNHRVRQDRPGRARSGQSPGAGSGGSDGDDGLATSARLDSPAAVATDTAGNVYVDE